MKQRIVARVLFVISAAAIGPFLGANGAPIAAAGALAAVALEAALARLPAAQILSGAAGIAAGLVLVRLLSPWLDGVTQPAHYAIVLALCYLGATLGASKASWGFEKLPSAEAPKDGLKILDTSVIIDGRVADICETGFLDGVLAVPQFVLRELQLVADSADSQKRNRGRRGLDVLQRLQKMPNVEVQVLEEDFPAVREVDLKLIELARLRHGRIVTNDFNLNKVAQVRGVRVLNINELANSLKPVVLPGETMRVFILKEGKEHNQGVAYLDDGTMVVVDNARRLISKTIEIAVTSVLQTTAGKMIFGRFDERHHTVVDRQERGVPAATGQTTA